MAGKGNRLPKSKKNKSAASMPEVEEKEELSAHGTRLENVGFVVDLFLDKNREVRLTQILHVKSNEGGVWKGWDEKQLLDFFVERANLTLPKQSIPAPETKEIDHIQGKDKEDPKEYDGVSSTEIESFEIKENDSMAGFVVADAQPSSTEQAHLDPPVSIGSMPANAPTDQRHTDKAKIAYGLEIVAGDALVHRLLSRGESFVIRLSIEPATLIQEPEADVRYSISLTALKKGRCESYFLTSCQGLLKAVDRSILVSIPRQNLEPGTYTFQADVKLSAAPSRNKEVLPPTLIRQLNLKSGLLQVI